MFDLLLIPVGCGKSVGQSAVCLTAFTYRNQTFDEYDSSKDVAWAVVGRVITPKFGIFLSFAGISLSKISFCLELAWLYYRYCLRRFLQIRAKIFRF